MPKLNVTDSIFLFIFSVMYSVGVLTGAYGEFSPGGCPVLAGFFSLYLISLVDGFLSLSIYWHKSYIEGCYNVWHGSIVLKCHVQRGGEGVIPYLVLIPPSPSCDIRWAWKSNIQHMVLTICPNSSDPFYIVSYYIKWDILYIRW